MRYSDFNVMVRVAEKRWNMKRRIETGHYWLDIHPVWVSVVTSVERKAERLPFRTCLAAKRLKAGFKFVTGKQVSGLARDRRPGACRFNSTMLSHVTQTFWAPAQWCLHVQSSPCVFSNRELHFGLSREISELLWIERKRWSSDATLTVWLIPPPQRVISHYQLPLEHCGVERF